MRSPRRSGRTDIERLRLFCRTVDDAMSRRAITDGTLTAVFSISVADVGLDYEYDHGDEDDLRSLLLDFRKFTAAKSDVFFYRSCNTLAKLFEDEQRLEQVERNRAAWKSATRDGFTLHQDGVNYSPERLFDIWINGIAFHDDQEAEAFYRGLDEMTRAIIKTQVSSTVLQGMKVLRSQRNLIEKAFADNLFAAWEVDELEDVT